MMTFSGVKEIAFVWLQNDDLVRMHSSRHLRRTIEHRVAYRLKPVCRGFYVLPLRNCIVLVGCNNFV